MSAQQTAVNLETIDVEAYAKEGKPVPEGARYRIRIDKEFKEVDAPSMTGRAILSLVGKAPEGHGLYRKYKGGATRPVAADEPVSFTEPGIERFQTLPKDATEG